MLPLQDRCHRMMIRSFDHLPRDANAARRPKGSETGVGHVLSRRRVEASAHDERQRGPT